MKHTEEEWLHSVTYSTLHIFIPNLFYKKGVLEK